MRRTLIKHVIAEETQVTERRCSFSSQTTVSQRTSAGTRESGWLGSQWSSTTGKSSTPRRSLVEMCLYVYDLIRKPAFVG